jgi:hypothetical protein
MSKYQILTQEGFKDFDFIRKTIKSKFLEIVTDKNILTCSFDHKLLKEDNTWAFAQDLYPGDKLVASEGVEEILTINPSIEDIELFDPINVRDTHSYIGNSFVNHNCAFQGTGDTYVDGEVLQEVTSNTSEDYIKEDRGRLRIWQQPEPQYQYVIGADTALGRGKDYSAFHVINLYNGQQVAEYYCNKVPVNEFAEVINRIGLRYNLAHVVVERNGIGSNVIDWLFTYHQYENLWMDDKGDFGFQVSNKSRDFILSNMEDAIRTNKVKINSTRTCDELSTFIITDTGKVEADEGYTDDLIMSLAIAIHVYNDVKNSTPIDYSVDTKNLKIPDYPVISRVNNKGTYGVMLEEDFEWFNK